MIQPTAAPDVIPERLIHRAAALTLELAAALETVHRAAIEAGRFRTTLEVLGDVEGDDWDHWRDSTGLAELTELLHAIQAVAAGYTESAARSLDGWQVCEIVRSARGNAERLSAG